MYTLARINLGPATPETRNLAVQETARELVATLAGDVPAQRVLKAFQSAFPNAIPGSVHRLDKTPPVHWQASARGESELDISCRELAEIFHLCH